MIKGKTYAQLKQGNTLVKQGDIQGAVVGYTKKLVETLKLVGFIQIYTY